MEGVLEWIRDALEAFFCRVDVCEVGRDMEAMEDMEGFLRSCSVDAGARS